MNRMPVGNAIVGQQQQQQPQQQQPGNVMMSRMTLRPQMARPAGTNTLAYQQPGQQIRMTLAKGPNGQIQIGQLQQQQQQQSQVAQQLAQQIAASGAGPQPTQNRQQLFEQHKRLMMQQQQQQIVAAGNEQQFSFNDNINELLNSPGVPNAQISMKPRQMMVVDAVGVGQNQMSPRGAPMPPQSPAGIAQLSPSPVQVSAAGGGRIFPSPQNVVTGQPGSALNNRLNFKQGDADSVLPPASPLLQGSPLPPNSQQQTPANIQQWQQQASPAQSSGGRLSAGPAVGIPSPSEVTNYGQAGALGFRSGQQSPSSTTQVSSATIIQQQQQQPPNPQGPNGQQILSLQKTNPMLNAQLSGMNCYIVPSVCVC